MMQKQSVRRPPAMNKATPIYVSLAQRLLCHIADKRLRPGDRLGTEHELVSRYGVSRVTVRQALLTLEEDGYVSRKKALGTFVKRSVDSSDELGFVRGCIVLACSNEQASHVDEDIAFATVLRSIEQAATRRNFSLQVLSFGSNPASDRTRLMQLTNRNDIKGICTIGACLDSYRELLPGLPVVTSCTWQPAPGLMVNPDMSEACRASVDYLLGHGHRDVALLCSTQIGQQAFSMFARAYTEAFESAGLTCPRHLMFQEYPGESLQKLAEKMISSPIRPTAVFAENSKACEAVLAAAASLGLKIPEDLSIIAFGRNALHISYPLAVTAYVPDHEGIGEQTINTLIAMINGDEVDQTCLAIPGKLVERDSVRTIDIQTEQER
jgi:GntR family transcriptional regulator, arabinose operon transcriptional repressor